MSGYGLPGANGASHTHAHTHHGHSHPYSNIYSSPSKPSASSSLLPSNGGFVQKPVSNGALYTHTETSRDNSRNTSPLVSPHEERPHWHTPYEQQHAHSFQDNARLSPAAPHHSHSRSWSPMMSRPRGESDLGRTADLKGASYASPQESIQAASTSWFSLPEALTSLLIPAPYLLASAAYCSLSGEELGGGTHPLPAYAMMQRGSGGHGRILPKQKFSSDSGFIEACTLTSGTLLLVGILGKLRASERVLDRRKDGPTVQQQAQKLLSVASAQSMVLRALSLGLPFFAAMQIGGLRTGLVLLTTTASALTSTDLPFRRTLHDWQHLLSSQKAIVAVLLLSVGMDFAGWTFHAPFTHMCLGYLALLLSAFVLPPPLPSLGNNAAHDSYTSPIEGSQAASLLTRSTSDVNTTLITGLLMSVLSITISMVWNTAPSLHPSAIVFSLLSIAVTSAGIIFAQPHLLRTSETKSGLGIGYFLTASCAFLYSPSIWPGTFLNGGISALSFLGILFDGNVSEKSVHEHSSTSHSHHHHHHHAPGEATYSAFTKFIMSKTEPGSLVYSILADKDSRRIAYFTTLNFAFMIVQGIYGYISGSLGLLSDTVHMFFDCLGLIVGLGAAVASKWPTSPEKPYGWGKLNTLAGFGNGIFLMLVSVEFVWEAIEGIVEGSELRHVQELLVVSVLGFLVNMVGLFAFGHAHAGHDHGHSHSHSQSHSHSHSHANGHAEPHACDHGHDHDKPHAHHHGHDHDNENMHGIFLHVAADAGGSLAVIISTVLTIWKPWYLWDPLATIIIAILIFAAAVPLVTSSGQKLLLVVPDDVEYNIKNTLQELSELRGVVGYAVPRFWVDDQDSASDGHGHHGHDHGPTVPWRQKIMGVVHVIAAYSADLEDVRDRVDDFVRERNMDLVIHVEREADGLCWCGGGPSGKAT